MSIDRPGFKIVKNPSPLPWSTRLHASYSREFAQFSLFLSYMTDIKIQLKDYYPLLNLVISSQWLLEEQI